MKSRLSLWLFLLVGCLAGWSAPQAQSQLTDAHWDNRFAVPGVQGNVMAMAFDKKRLYLGGPLQSVGRVVAESVAEFDGKRWRALPDGPQQHPLLLNVMALEMFKNRLYVGGFFTNAGGQPAGGLASWHGNKWSVPGGTNGVVYALRADGKDGLLVGGRFTLPGWTNPVALARYGGKKEWEVLNSELPPCGPADLVCLDAIQQLEILPNREIVVMLSFKVRNEWGGWDPYPYFLLLRCDQSNYWSNFPGPDGDPYGLGHYHLSKHAGKLVAAGAFINAANPAIRNIALWNGSTWQPLGEGVEGEVQDVVGNDRILYVLHRWNAGQLPPVYGVSQWDGVGWRRLGTSPFQGGDPVNVFLGPEGELYVTGLFAGVGDVVAPGLVRWNGQSWEPLFEGAYEGVAGLTHLVLALAEHQGSVFMGGIFTSAGRSFSPGIARWDGARWQEVGGGLGPLAGQVVALASSGSRLYAGGVFTNIGGGPAANIASWDGANWQPLGAGVADRVHALAWWEGSLFAGGQFRRAGNAEASHIARWDGAAWHPLGTGCNSNVNTLTVWRDSLYVGGLFTNAGGVAASRLARWDGSRWHEVSGGVSGVSRPSVNALAAGPDGLYVGGAFAQAGAVAARNLARWDGTNWHAVGGGYSGTVTALAFHEGNLFVGGRWTDNLGQTLHAMLRWDGTNWSPLGSGLTQPHGRPHVSALLATSDALWVGGRFTTAGAKPSANIARWVERPRLHIAHDLGNPLQPPRLRLRSEPGLNLRLETSADLCLWQQVHVERSNHGEWIVDALKDADMRFFRAVINP